MKRSKALFVVAAVLGSLLIAIPDARACSCMASDPRDELHASEGAFIGTYIGREPVDLTDPYADWDYIFDADEVFKGEIGERVEVRSASNGAACGFEYAEGDPAALFVYREEGVWHSNLCRTVFPDALREAAAPFPAPDAKGPPRFLIGGSFGEVRVLALDAQGRTAGYGYGEGDGLYMSLCPGGDLSIEVVGGYRHDDRRFVDVRRISDLKVVSTAQAPPRWQDEYVSPEDATCTSRDGSAVVFSSGYSDGKRYRELTRFTDGRSETILRTKAAHAAIGRKKAFLARGRRISVVNLRTGGKTPVRSFRSGVSHLALSPDGSRLAFIMGAKTEGGELAIMRAGDGKVTARRSLDGEASYGKLEWVSRGSLFFWGLSSRSPILDRSLRKTAEVTDWFPQTAVRLGCSLYGAGYGAVTKASACDGGSLSVTREFFSPVIYSMLKLPGGTEISAPPEG